jgi:hypothetical protein
MTMIIMTMMMMIIIIIIIIHLVESHLDHTSKLTAMRFKANVSQVAN